MHDFRDKLFPRIKDVVDLDRMQRCRVAIIGAGGSVGLACNLVRSGLKAIDIYDFDHVALENISRQAHCFPSIEMPKTEACRIEAQRINPDVEVRCFDGDVTKMTETEIAVAFASVDLIINATDSFAAHAAGITSKARAHNETHPAYKYHPNQLYDKCVSQLFKERLHKDAGYTIYFARRGKSDRTEALEKALEAARTEFRKRWGGTGTAPIEIVPSNPRDVVGLQAVDYFLWALQRFYERGEDRFLTLIWPKTKLVIDVDDTRNRGYLPMAENWLVPP